LGERLGSARALHTLGTVALERNDNERAARLISQLLSEYGSPAGSSDSPWAALAFSQLPGAVSRLGDQQRALDLGRQGLLKQQEAGSGPGIALALVYLGDIALDWGNVAEAHTRYREGLALMWQMGDRWHLLHALAGFSIMKAEIGPAEDAARLFGAHAAARAATGHRIALRYLGAFDAAIAKVRATIGEEAFSVAWAEGMALGLEEAVAEALEV
jgi:tetratricopeptide (TPR) repeat protein